MSDTRVYSFGNEGATSNLLASYLPLLTQKGIDPSALYAMGGNGFGNFGINEIIALVVIAAIFGNGNGNGIFGGNGNNNAEREMLMSAIQRNGTDLSQLAQSINCNVGRLDSAIDNVASQICALSAQTGQSSMSIINAIQAGNSALAKEICDCCCKTQQAILESNYLTERGFCNTNQILTKGFSDLGYAFANQTCDIEKAIATSTSQILEGQRAAEMRDMQDKLDALREKNAQQAVILNNAQQTSQFAAMLAPIQADLAELKCNQLPVKKIACPETYVPINNSINATYGLVPYCSCGYGAGFGFGNGWNGWNGGSLWG